MDEAYELHPRDPPSNPPTAMPGDLVDPRKEALLNKKTVRKLDLILLPFLALLFLFNSLDKSNIGNAESAHFTSDIGLEKEDINTAVALFFAFFVALQPLGAALGRKYGMVRWVPSCMIIWGASTALHVWVRSKWQLYILRIIIGACEAGFYPVTVVYLSVFYTRFEFARRLSLFYGQAAVGGALGGILSYLVFSQFTDERTNQPDGSGKAGWKSWQVLFLLEGCSTVIIAFAGYFWLPHNAKTAWFLTPQEREWAELRVQRDTTDDTETSHHTKPENDSEDEEEDDHPDPSGSESHGLLRPSSPTSTKTVTDDRGITPHDILSALTAPKIYHILIVNILSAIPGMAFQVFLPLVLAPFTSSHTTPDELPKTNPALTNLLTAPPYICGAITLFAFAAYSDRHRKRLPPILCGLCLLITGLVLVVIMPQTKAWAIPRYLSLNVLLSGTFIASPLTVAWISGNTPSPGKRAVLLGINGWGNLAGVFSALLFKPKYQAEGYITPFWWTLGAVSIAAVGYVLFWLMLRRENEVRMALVRSWDPDDVEAERRDGRGPVGRQRGVVLGLARLLAEVRGFAGVAEWVEKASEGREGDERVTFVWGY